MYRDIICMLYKYIYIYIYIYISTYKSLYMCEWLEKNKEKNFLIKDNIMLIYIVHYKIYFNEFTYIYVY